ncbi:lytic transglycosylase domain-containing protein [Cereibacter changlensis]|nr:lytic transglycosylase domain-containing protein [Cereibacter changlensis]
MSALAKISANRFRLALFLLMLATAVSALARSADPPGLCEAAAFRAARQTEVPVAVLQSLALTETGRSVGPELRPWPWTVNVAGEGHWFATRAEAERFASETLLSGQGNFDVGCFQINYRWHGAHFGSVREMFDPDANALYAARFLQTLDAGAEDWSRAAGAYHSAVAERARIYRARFDRIFANVGEEVPTSYLRASNGFPLLQPGATGSGGSVVPVGHGASLPLIGY